MEETEFHARADQALETLETALEEAGIDAELLGGILTIEADSGTFVLNKHLPTRQLWLASPVSGAARFGYDAGTWKHAATHEPLDSFLKREVGF